jgi:hypothetical protein
VLSRPISAWHIPRQLPLTLSKVVVLVKAVNVGGMQRISLLRSSKIRLWEKLAGQVVLLLGFHRYVRCWVHSFLQLTPIANNGGVAQESPLALVMPRLPVSCKEETMACPNTALFLPQFVTQAQDMWGLALQKSCRRCSGRIIDEIVAMYAYIRRSTKQVVAVELAPEGVSNLCCHGRCV